MADSSNLTRGVQVPVVIVLSTLLGIGLNVLVLRDMFQTLFAPRARGHLSRMIAHLIWRLMRRLARHWRRVLTLAGPLSLLLIVLLWAIGLIVGWACLLWPHLPQGFLFSTNLAPAQNQSFWDAVYVSIVTLVTVGYGDITPQATWLRLVVPLEALVGFALLTAAISWVMSCYPAVARRRQFAYDVSLIAAVQHREGLDLSRLNEAAYSALLRSLTQQVITVRNDFAHFSITYYFWTPDRRLSPDVALVQLVAIARQACHHPSPSVQWNAALLLAALDGLTTYLAETWLHYRSGAAIEEVVCAYVADQMHDIPC